MENLQKYADLSIKYHVMLTCIKTAFKSGFVAVAVYDHASKEYHQEEKNHSILFINDFYELLEKLKA